MAVAERYELEDGMYLFVANGILCLYAGNNTNYRLKGVEKENLIVWLEGALPDAEQAAPAG